MHSAFEGLKINVLFVMSLIICRGSLFHIWTGVCMKLLSREHVLVTGRVRAWSGMAVHRRCLVYDGGSLEVHGAVVGVHFLQVCSSNLSSVVKAGDGEL